jgi:hypothetical protein
MAGNLQFPAQRLYMLLAAQRPFTDTYPVEASGWDSAQSFFVEKSELEWNEVTGKHLTLTRSLCPGSMIFLRLLQPLSRVVPFPWLTTPTRPGSRLRGNNNFA